jgi:hypothetical protein
MLGFVTVRSPDDRELGCPQPSLPDAAIAWIRHAQRAAGR